jgi:hypothetical protein
LSNNIVEEPTVPKPIVFSKHGNALKYSHKVRLEAINLFIAFGGNRSQVGEKLHIPYETLRQWEREDWWKDSYAVIKQQENLVVSAKLHKIILASLGQLEERIEFGDFVFDQKKSTIVRKPVGARDLHTIISDSVDKKIKLERPQQAEQDVVNVMDKLAALAANFSKLAQAQQSKTIVEVTDVVFAEETTKKEDNAIHEERPENG